VTCDAEITDAYSAALVEAADILIVLENVRERVVLVFDFALNVVLRWRNLRSQVIEGRTAQGYTREQRVIRLQLSAMPCTPAAIVLRTDPARPKSDDA
jgi:hypothetical protein